MIIVSAHHPELQLVNVFSDYLDGTTNLHELNGLESKESERIVDGRNAKSRLRCYAKTKEAAFNFS